VVAVGDQPNIPHIELDLAKNDAIGKIKEAVSPDDEARLLELDRTEESSL